MGTRSLIGKRLKDGSILGVYCHYDGYPQYNGRVLRDVYNTDAKVSDLIDGGDMSCVYTNAGWNNETLPESGPLYYTMRGESYVQNAPNLYENLNEFLCAADSQYDAEYTYYYDDGEWTCHALRSENRVKEVAIPEGSVTDGIFKDA